MHWYVHDISMPSSSSPVSRSPKIIFVHHNLLWWQCNNIQHCPNLQLCHHLLHFHSPPILMPLLLHNPWLPNSHCHCIWWHTQRWCSLVLLMIVPPMMVPPTMVPPTMALPKMVQPKMTLLATAPLTVAQPLIVPPKTAPYTQLLLLQPTLHHKGTLIKRGPFWGNTKHKS